MRPYVRPIRVFFRAKTVQLCVDKLVAMGLLILFYVGVEGRGLDSLYKRDCRW